MFSTLRGFLSRHKRKFLVTGVIVGGAVLATRYAQRKLREWQEKESREFLDRTRRTQHFESTERTCNQTILSLAPAICDAIFNTLNTEEILEKLRNNPDNKVLLWDELKVLAFTKLAAVVYASTILVVTLRIQLNLVGGYVYKNSRSEVTILTSEDQEKYLSLCHYLLNNGTIELCKIVEENARSVVQPVALKHKLTLSDIEQLFWSIQAAISKDSRDPAQKISSFIIPEDTEGSDMLKTMIDETLDLLESQDVLNITTSCISRGFATLVDRLAEYFGPQNNTKDKIVEISAGTSKSELNTFINLSKVDIAMAKIIPIVNGLVIQSFNKLSEAPEALIQELILHDKIKTLGANVYEVFSN